MELKFIELVGLPGCGKSTLVKSMMETLSKDEKVVVLNRKSFSSIINFMWKNRWSIPFIAVYKLLFSCHLKLKMSLIRYIYQYDVNSLSIIYAIYIVDIYSFVKKNNYKNMIILLDEGIIQFLSSIAHNIKIENNSDMLGLYSSLRDLTENSVYVRCNIPLDIAVQRIKIRNRNDRFAYSDTLTGLLKVKQDNINYLLEICTSKSCIVELDMTKSTEYNKETILKKIL